MLLSKGCFTVRKGVWRIFLSKVSAQYPGRDRFNRVSELRWVRPNGPPFVELERSSMGSTG